MEEKLDFSLPDEKRKSPLASKVSILLLLILVFLAVANLFVVRSRRNTVPKATSHDLSAEQVKQLAGKLAQRNLYQQAARAWQDYLATAALSDTERAKTLFQIGTLLEKAALYAEAIEYYYRCEMAAKLDELEPQINTHIKNCFEKLGQFSALRYELMDRTSFKGSQASGSKIVAEIGAEKMTEADLDALIETNIDNQLAPMAVFMTGEQLNEQKRKVLEQYKAPQAKLQFLQSWLAQEILYRQALQEQLGEKPEIKKLLGELARSVLSQQLMNQQLASKINITETDLQTYYTANKGKYSEPAKARISHILVKDQQQAKDLIKRIKDGEDFGKLAKEFSEDENTKENGGQIDIDVTVGSYVPVIGDANDLNQEIFAAEAPAVLDEPFKTEKGWEIVKVNEKQPERQKSFDEVRQQVLLTLTSQKRQEVQQDYIERMMDEYNVVIHRSALMPSQESESAQGSSAVQK
jgi:parvulin-like peptidyl-prolyl isomerase